MTAKTGSAPASQNSSAQFWLHFKNKLLSLYFPNQRQQLLVQRNLLLCPSLTHALHRRHTPDQSAAGETVNSVRRRPNTTRLLIWIPLQKTHRPSDSIICMCEQRSPVRPLEKTLWVLSLQPPRLLARRPAWFSGSRLLADSRDMSREVRASMPCWGTSRQQQLHNAALITSVKNIVAPSLSSSRTPGRCQRHPEGLADTQKVLTTDTFSSRLSGILAPSSALSLQLIFWTDSKVGLLAVE